MRGRILFSFTLLSSACLINLRVSTAQDVYPPGLFIKNSSLEVYVAGVLWSNPDRLVSIDDLRESPLFGQRFSNELDFAELREAFVDIGIPASYRKSLNTSDLISELSSERMAIIPRSGNPKSPDYFAITSDGSEHFKIFKYPVLGEAVELRSLMERVSGRLGKGVIILERGDPTPSAVAGAEVVEWEEQGMLKVPREILAQMLPRGVRRYKYEVQITNIGERDLTVEKVSGSCSCFIEANVPEVIGAGEKVNAEFWFDLRPFFTKEAFATTILFKTDDNDEPIKELQFRGEFAENNDVFIDLSTRDFGRVKSSKISDLEQFITLYANTEEAIDITGVEVFPREMATLEKLDFGKLLGIGEMIPFAKYAVSMDAAAMQNGKNEIEIIFFTSNPIYSQLSAAFDVTVE